MQKTLLYLFYLNIFKRLIIFLANFAHQFNFYSISERIYEVPNKLFYWSILLTLLFTVTTNAQTVTLSGRVTNLETTLPIPNCNIFIRNFNIGTTTDLEGFYSIKNLSQRKYTVVASFIGFKRIEKVLTLTRDSILNISLTPKSILLKETIVKANSAKLRETPTAFTEKNRIDVDRELGSQDIPHLLQTTPSLYISQQGGGTGDLRMNLRGFDHTHFAVMINGVPINNPENGEIYWSNWSGIGDVVDKIQVQRGLTANPYSSSAIGGLVNIKTVGVNSNKDFIKLHSEFGSDNFRKFSVAFNNHIIKNKLAITGLVSKKDWDGYATETKLNEYTYFIGVGGIWDNHSIELTAIGSPQKHGQRMTRQSIETWETHGKRFNPDLGYLNKTPINIRDNEYHNPTITLNHNWQINKNTLISNLLYYIPGKGGGTVPPWIQFERTSNGLINFDNEYKHNSNNIDSTYSTTLNKTENSLRFFSHTHQWFGLLSTLKYTFSKSTFTFGIDYRYYVANNHQEVGNLLGGDYTIGFAGQNNNYASPLFKGDKIDFDADSFAKHLGGFFQYEFNSDLFSYYFNSTLAATGYNRIDYFNYSEDDPDRETGWESFLEYSFKSGVNYNLDKLNNIFLNFGLISKPPLSFNVFDYNNKKFKNVENENMVSLEVGYGFQDKIYQLTLNIFYTLWKNKIFNRTQQNWATGQFFFLNISGADSRHYGVEMDSKINIAQNFAVMSMISVSNNKFTSNAITAKSPEENPTNIEYSTSYVKGTFLPNFPMLTASLAFLYQTQVANTTSFFVKPILSFYGNQFAQFDPTLRSNSTEQDVNSWKLPNIYLINLHFGVSHKLDKSFLKEVSFNFHLFNLLNQDNYIIDAIDGANHKATSALVWYGRERWWNIGVSFSF